MLAGRAVHQSRGAPSGLPRPLARDGRLGVVRTLVGAARGAAPARRGLFRGTRRNGRPHALHLRLPRGHFRERRLVEAQPHRHDRAGLSHAAISVEGAPRGGDGRAREPGRRRCRPPAVRRRGRRPDAGHRHEPRLLHDRGHPRSGVAREDRTPGRRLLPDRRLSGCRPGSGRPPGDRRGLL